jgi:uncharacterized membrane protein
VLRLLGAILLIVGLILVVTIIGAPVGVWFMLFGVLLLIFGGGARRVIVKYQDRPRRREPKAQQQLVAPRADAADEFNEAVRLYQKHHGHQDAGAAIRVLATDALRQQGFLR